MLRAPAWRCSEDSVSSFSLLGSRCQDPLPFDQEADTQRPSPVPRAPNLSRFQKPVFNSGKKGSGTKFAPREDAPGEHQRPHLSLCLFGGGGHIVCGKIKASPFAVEIVSACSPPGAGDTGRIKHNCYPWGLSTGWGRGDPHVVTQEPGLRDTVRAGALSFSSCKWSCGSSLGSLPGDGKQCCYWL